MKTDGNGMSQYYSKEIMEYNTVLQVTNVAYIEKTLYLWLTSLM